MSLTELERIRSDKVKLDELIYKIKIRYAELNKKEFKLNYTPDLTLERESELNLKIDQVKLKSLNEIESKLKNLET